MAVLHEVDILTFGQEGFLKDVRFFLQNRKLPCQLLHFRSVCF